MATTDEPKITMDTIRQCAPIIRQYMDRESLYPYLLQYSLLTNDEMYHFTSKDKSPSESGNYLIKILETKGFDSAQKFYQCLQEEAEHVGHSDIVKHLRNTALQGNLQAVIKSLMIIYGCFTDTSCKVNAQEMSAVSLEKGAHN